GAGRPTSAGRGGGPQPRAAQPPRVRRRTARSGEAKPTGRPTRLPLPPPEVGPRPEAPPVPPAPVTPGPPPPGPAAAPAPAASGPLPAPAVPTPAPAVPRGRP